MAVLGVDACRAGWVGALLDATTYDVLVAASFGELWEQAAGRARLEVVAVDIPIGLPDDAPRLADLLARQRLPAGRKSSVYPAPTRVATEQTTHVEASAANREATDGMGLSIQAFHLVPKILEVDAAVRSGLGATVVEAHPEVCFAELEPGCVVPSKRTREGRASRAAALRAAGLEPPAYRRGQGYAADDLLDACAVAWTARRRADGTATCLPDPPEVFSDGLPAAIWV
jgi:predicted RNase H-like nuclease